MITPKEVFSAETGTGASTEVTRKELRILHASRPIMAKMTLTYGETPTITIQLQGKQIMKTAWETIAEETFTEGTPQYIHQADGEKRFEKYRLNISANTSVTVDKAYIGIGHVEN